MFMVKLSDLTNNQNKRKVRDIVTIGGDTIRVFEPSKSDIQRIIELQEAIVKEGKESEKENNEETVQVKSSGSETIRVLFPLLTDIEGIDELTDEEIDEVVENPSLAFLQVNHIIEGIVTEIWKMVILEARNRVLETDFKIESTKAMREMNEKTLGLLEREGKGDLIEKLDEARDKYEKAKVEKDQSEVAEMERRMSEEVQPKEEDKAVVALERYKKAFS